MRYDESQRLMSAILICVFVWVAASPQAFGEEKYPDFNRQYWEAEEAKAHGKIMRGAVLGATGLVTVAPTAVLAIKASENPEQYLAYSAVVGIAALGMTLHGFFSIGFGARERDAASRFAKRYALDPGSVKTDEERSWYLKNKKKSTGKMVLFGIVLDIQAAVLLANGSVLAVRESRGDLSSDVRIWPSFLAGGLLLLGGTAFAIWKGRQFVRLKDLEGRPSESVKTYFMPILGIDPVERRPVAGIIGGVRF